MPALRWLYLTAQLSDRTAATCVAMSEAVHTVPHDRWTSMLPAAGSGQTLRERTWRMLFVWGRGDLRLDAPVISTPYAPAMEGLAWGFSSTARRPVYGVSLGLLVWTAGPLRRPLRLRLWQRPLHVRVGAGVAERCPPPLALSPGVCAL
jgi:hypothetical protein